MKHFLDLALVVFMAAIVYALARYFVTGGF